MRLRLALRPNQLYLFLVIIFTKRLYEFGRLSNWLFVTLLVVFEIASELLVVNIIVVIGLAALSSLSVVRLGVVKSMQRLNIILVPS